MTEKVFSMIFYLKNHYKIHLINQLNQQVKPVSFKENKHLILLFIEAYHKPLPKAPPPPPRELTQDENDRLCRQREAVLRELRVFLRDATNKLLAERKFKEFTKPVDSEEVNLNSIIELFNLLFFPFFL